MVQELNAIYDTIYETDFGNNNLTITIQPGSAGPNTIEAELFLEIGQKITDNTPGDEGDLLMIMRNTLKLIDFEIDENGDLIVHAPDANNYSLDDEGNLIYTWR